MSTAVLTVVFEIAHQMALAPLLFLAWRGRRAAEWWWLAGGIFGVSWLADSAAHVIPPAVVSLVYPLTQAAIVGAVLLSRSDAQALAVMLFGVALVAVLPWDGGRDVLLRSAAWGSVAWIAYRRPSIGRLRVALLVAFGLGWVSWLAYAIAPGWWTWGVYQAVRAASIAAFCWAAATPSPMLRLTRGGRLAGRYAV